MNLGVLEQSSNLEIQPAFKNNSFLVKKQAAGKKPWQDCTLKDVWLVTSFAQLQDYFKMIPAKITRYDKIHQIRANWKYLAEFDWKLENIESSTCFQAFMFARIDKKHDSELLVELPLIVLSNKGK